MVSFEAGQRPLGVDFADDDDEDMVLATERLDIERLFAVDVVPTVGEILRVENDAVAEDELLEVREATMEGRACLEAAHRMLKALLWGMLLNTLILLTAC